MLPPNYVPRLYNPFDYIGSFDYLTINIGDLRYNKRYGINYTSDLYVTGNIYQSGNLVSLAGLEYVTGIPPGTTIGSKALVVDSNLDVSGIRNLATTSNLTVTNGTTPILLAIRPHLQHLDVHFKIAVVIVILAASPITTFP